MTIFDTNTTAEEVAQSLSKRISGKNVLISGASPGSLGAEAARVIAKHANLVVLAGRDPAKIHKTIDMIKNEMPPANLRLLALKLDSLADVRKAAAEVNAYTEPIHVLINSAAILAAPFSRTGDGFERHMAVNHFGPFLFTASIFGRILEGGTPDDPSRIVNISSEGHTFSGIRFDDLDFSDGTKYNKFQGYGQSKTANMLFSNEIARRAREKAVPVVSYSVHPGVVGGTNLGVYMSQDDLVELGIRSNTGKWLVRLKRPQQGAASYIVAAFDHSILSNPGAYIADSDISNDIAPHAQSQENGEKLWELSENAVGTEFII